MAEAAAAAEAAEAAARGALRAAEEALRLGEALREALAAGRLELARARYALGPARVCAAAAPRAALQARLRVATAPPRGDGPAAPPAGPDPWDLRAVASALPGAAPAGTAGGSAPADASGGVRRWRLAEERGAAAGGDPLAWFGAAAGGGGSPHLVRAQARFQEAAALAVELAGLRRGLQRLPPAPAPPEGPVGGESHPRSRVGAEGRGEEARGVGGSEALAGPREASRIAA